MTNRDKLLSILTNYDPYLGCYNCPIFTPDRPCTYMEAGKVSNAFDEWLNKEAEK